MTEEDRPDDVPPTHDEMFEVAPQAVGPSPAAREHAAHESSAPLSEPHAKPVPAPKRRLDSDESGLQIKETLESILVAFILAFIFRCFVVEAFVIPTGSMAPTLMGAHTRYQCPECGYTFEVNFSPHTRGPNDDDAEIPPFAGPYRRGTQTVNDVYTDVVCPNCDYRLPNETNPPVYYGDRILVLKYAYLIEKPRRWQVVVFKTPVEPHRFEWNFIKRLIGLPGETIMVLDGDVYVKRKGEDAFVIQTKTPEAQEALWRIIYDDDHRPARQASREAPWVEPWQMTAGTGWTTHLPDGTPGLWFNNAGAGTLTFNANADRKGNHGFTDWLAYDQGHDGPHSGYDGRYAVSDLKLDFFYERNGWRGPLRLSMTKLDDRFVADIFPDRAVLHHDSRGREILPAKTVPLTGLSATAPWHVQFTNVDYRVTLRIDGHDVLQTTPQEYFPDVDDLIQRTRTDNSAFHQFRRGPGDSADEPFPAPTVQITAVDQVCRLTHVTLWRDVYYTHDAGGRSIIHGSPTGDPAHKDTGPIVLGDGEYFVMGDNSPLSFDARFWDDPIHLPDESLDVASGRVPERFMLGRAFFVYWPAGFRPTPTMPGLVPNFGQMRFIR